MRDGCNVIAGLRDMRHACC